jgi:tRNA(fMet)-specific endonuclease VapC
MAYILDTNTCVYVIKRQPISVKEKFMTIDPDQLFISSITLAELEYGVAKSSQVKNNSIVLKEFLSRIKVVDFDSKAAYHYGLIRSSLEKKGTPIGSNDLLIAAIAMGLDFTLITNNEREFMRVEGLKIANWIIEK